MSGTSVVLCRESYSAEFRPGENIVFTPGTARQGRIGPRRCCEQLWGELSIQDDVFVYSRREGPTIRMPLSAIQGAFLSQEDKQVGGMPMALVRAATPYGGGRVISLFAHKKYDFMTLEYFDSNGGLHGTIYQLNKGQGQVLADELGAKGVHVSGLEIATAKPRLETDNVK